MEPDSLTLTQNTPFYLEFRKKPHHPSWVEGFFVLYDQKKLTSLSRCILPQSNTQWMVYIGDRSHHVQGLCLTPTAHPRQRHASIDGWVFGVKTQGLPSHLEQMRWPQVFNDPRLFHEMAAGLRPLEHTRDAFDPLWQTHSDTKQRASLSDTASDGVAVWAEALGLSPRQLHRQIKGSWGLTPKQVLSLNRFQQSLLSLMFKQQSLGDMALTLGYSDQAHFNRAFKVFSGTTPLQFQRHYGSVRFIQYPTPSSALHFALTL